MFKVTNDVKEPFLEIKCATPEGERYLNFFMGMDEVPSSLKFFYRILKMFEKNDRLGKMLLPTKNDTVTPLALVDPSGFVKVSLPLNNGKPGMSASIRVLYENGYIEILNDEWRRRFF